MANISIPITINLPDDWKEQILERIKQDGDWVLVTRCEDCEYWSDSNQCVRPELSGNRWHDAKYFDTLPDDFCSYGEMREDTSNG